MSTRTPQNFFEVLQKFTTVRYNFRIAVKRGYDEWALKQIWSNKKLKSTINAQSLDLSAHTKLGSDIATSMFVINYCKGQVRNENGRWLTKSSEIPKHYTNSFKLTGIYAKRAGLISEGIDNFVSLDHLECLDLSHNDKLDNFACDQLSRQFKNSKSLKEIDISYNPRISIYGLEILFRIPSLRKIIAIDTEASKHQEIDLFVLAAEDERQCDVFVHGDGRKYIAPELEDLRASQPKPQIKQIQM